MQSLIWQANKEGATAIKRSLGLAKRGVPPHVCITPAYLLIAQLINCPIIITIKECYDLYVHVSATDSFIVHFAYLLILLYYSFISGCMHIVCILFNKLLYLVSCILYMTRNQ